MTKKTFGQRFISGLTSVMMAVMSFVSSPGSVPIRAADGDTHKVTFEVYENDGETRSYVQNNDNSKYYYMLVSLYNKSDDMKSALPVGWSLKKFSPDVPNADEKTVSWWPEEVKEFTTYKETIDFDTFYAYGKDGTQTEETVNYNVSAHNTKTYVYTTDEEVTNYAECKEKGNPNISLYRYLYNDVVENSTTIKIKKDIVAYKVHIDFDNAPVKEEDYLYLLVTVKHKTGGDTFYVEQVNSSVSDYVVQTADTQNWYASNGNAEPNERLNGGEQITAVLVKSKEPVTVKELFALLSRLLSISFHTMLSVVISPLFQVTSALSGRSG